LEKTRRVDFSGMMLALFLFNKLCAICKLRLLTSGQNTLSIQTLRKKEMEGVQNLPVRLSNGRINNLN